MDKQICVRLDRELHRQVLDLAAQQYRTPSQVVRMLLMQAVAAKTKKNKKAAG